MSIKIQKSSQKINPFGGINFVVEALKQKGIAKLIDHKLGKRSDKAQYKYSDIILANTYTTFCGGDYLEDIHKIKELCGEIPNIKLPSSDRVGDLLRELKQENEIIISESGIKHEFNYATRHNEMIMDIIMRLNLLNTTQYYTIDYDNTIIETEKFDSKKTYKHTKGYQPGVAFINKIPVYIEGRNGNNNACFQLKETLQRAFTLLESRNIKIKRFRSDSAAYQKEVIDFCEQKDSEFFIRITDCSALQQQISDITQWQQIRINNQFYDVASIEYYPFNQTEKSYRVVVRREKRKDKQLGIWSGEYNYGCIITSNYDMNDKEVIEFYNKRGAIEKNFDVLKNDFNWARLPFSDLDSNTVFMIVAAIANVIYLYMIDWISSKVKWIKSNFRLKNFIFHFITVASKWINHGRQSFLKLFSDRPYELLLS